MEKDKLLDMALEKIMNELDDIEGTSANSHSLEECPDPLNCKMHDGELDGLAPEKQEDGSPSAVTVEVHKMGLPSLTGGKEKEGEGLSEEEAEELRKLLK